MVLISITACELWSFEIFNLAFEVKFDHVGQSSFGSKVAYLTKGLCRKEIVLISIIVSELWPFEIFNLASEVKYGLGGQSSFRSKVVYLAILLPCKVSLEYILGFLSYE